MPSLLRSQMLWWFWDPSVVSPYITQTQHRYAGMFWSSIAISHSFLWLASGVRDTISVGTILKPVALLSLLFLRYMIVIRYLSIVSSFRFDWNGESAESCSEDGEVYISPITETFGVLSIGNSRKHVLALCSRSWSANRPSMRLVSLDSSNSASRASKDHKWD